MLRPVIRTMRSSMLTSIRLSSTSRPQASVGTPLSAQEIHEVLSKPSWSVTELTSGSSKKSSETLVSGASGEEQITPQKLHHLLRLSALPLPRSAEEEQSMIKTLEAQLHFVRAVQRVDTTGVEPLVAIRDERAEAKKAKEFTLESLKHVLDQEEQVGHYRRIVKKTTTSKSVKRDAETKATDCSTSDTKSNETDEQDLNWDPLARAPETIGRFIKVNTEQR